MPKTLPQRICIAALLATIGGTTAAQDCRDISIPFAEFRFANVTGGASGLISADGSRLVLQAVPPGAAPGAGAEVFLFNPFDGRTQQLTTGTAAATSPIGTPEPYARSVSGITADGSKLFLAGSASSSFPIVNRPGAPSAQEEVLIGAAGPAEVLDLVSNTRTTLRTLDVSNLRPDQLYSASISAQSSDGNQLLLSEAIIDFVDYTAPSGRTFRVVLRRGTVATGLYDLRTGVYTDVVSQIVAATGVPNFLPTNPTGIPYLMSGDANAFAFQSDINLFDPQKRFWSQTPGNVAGVNFVAYVYYRDVNRIAVIGPPDLAGPTRPAGASSSIFVRNIGNSGRRFALDRGAPWLGAERNPTWQAAPAVVEVGQNVRYLVPPLPQLPDRGIFTNSLARISKNERYVYFSHTSDLVAGLNPGRSQELYQFDLQTNRIRQITQFNDDLFARFGALLQSPNLSGTYQISVQGSDEASDRVIAYTRSGFISTRGVTRDASGRVLISNNDVRTAADVYRVAVCN